MNWEIFLVLQPSENAFSFFLLTEDIRGRFTFIMTFYVLLPRQCPLVFVSYDSRQVICVTTKYELRQWAERFSKKQLKIKK
jgi:hypothetical protein